MPNSRSGIIRQGIGPSKARLIKNVDFANRVLDQAIPSTTSEREKLTDDIAELHSKLTNGIGTLTASDNKWQDLMLSLDDDLIPEEERLYASVASADETGYLAVIEGARDVLCILERRRGEIQRVTDLLPAAAAGVATALDRTSRTNAKLPKLNLPVFSGNHFEWGDFWNIFSANVGDRDMSGAEKFAYLRGQLAGTAARSIAGIPTTNDNYSIAVAILKERYERSGTQLVGSLYSQLKRLPVSTEKVSDLMSTYDSCEKIFRQLEAAGESIGANRSLVLDVLSKYPSKVVKDLLVSESIGPHSELAELRDRLRKYIKNRESLAEIMDDLNPFSTKSTIKASKSDPGGSPTTSQTSAFAAADSNVSPAPSNPCYFCGGNHFNSQCNVFPNAESRRDRLRILQRCLRCLGAGHIQKNCRLPQSKVRCYFCRLDGSHVSPLCPKKFAPSCGGDVPKTSDASLQSADSNVNEDDQCTTNLLSVNEHAILLTALTRCTNAEHDVELPTRIVFDSGSHRSYITESCANRLKLSGSGGEFLKVAVFGSKRTLTVNSKRVSVNILQRDGQFLIVNAHTTPLITHCFIRAKSVPDEDVHTIRSLGNDLADDFSSCDGTVDILIGSDYFWEFVNGSPRKTPSGLHLIPSTLGYLLAGRYYDWGESSTLPALFCFTETFGPISIDNNERPTFTQSRLVPQYPDIDEFWQLETIGIKDHSIKDQRTVVVARFQATTTVLWSNLTTVCARKMGVTR